MRVNVLGNGDNAGLFQRGTKGKLLICNMPPFEIPRSEVLASYQGILFSYSKVCG